MDLSLDLSTGQPTSGDLVLVGGDLVLTADANPVGTQPILQNILQVLRVFRGEYFLDKSYGVPYYQKILVRAPDRTEVDTLIQTAILSVRGVSALVSYQGTYTTATRLISITFRVLTARGLLTYSGPI